MATRREAREWALQLIFMLDFNSVANADLESLFGDFWKLQVQLFLEKKAEDNPGSGDAAPDPDSPQEKFVGADILAPPRLREFSESLARGVWENRNEIDDRIESYTNNGANSWPVYRMGAVDRNVLRLAFFEMFYSEETPPVVCINEAIDLAKYFSNSNSGAFVNGILDHAKRDLTRPERTVAKAPRKRHERKN